MNFWQEIEATGGMGRTGLICAINRRHQHSQQQVKHLLTVSTQELHHHELLVAIRGLKLWWVRAGERGGSFACGPEREFYLES